MRIKNRAGMTCTATLVATLAVTSLASGQASVDQAKVLFNAGATAYASGQFNAAIQAFESANKLVPKPAIVFSIAQAHRRQYFLDKDVEHLRVAVAKYREYVAEVPEGGRRADAAQALAELEPILSKAGAEPAQAARPAAKAPARVMVMSQTEGAIVTLDGKPTKDATEVAPGKHHVVVTATGFFDDERDVLAVDGALVPVDVVLREKPARLSIHAADNAQVTLDGRPAGTTPLSTPIELPAGVHFVVVTKNGFRAYTEEIDLSRDERREMEVHLQSTTQRVAAYSFLAAGSAALVAGGIITGVTASKQSTAEAILDRSVKRNITTADLKDYENARKSRDDLAAVSLVTLAMGGVIMATGLVLYAFDQPVVSSPPSRYENRPKKPAITPSEPAEMSVLPIVSPYFVGGSFAARF